MTSILGISAFYHDSAAALVVDGEIVAAASEERFTRTKHDAAFPRHAVEYCLAEAGLEKEQLDYVGFYDKPLLKFERLLETTLAVAPSGFASFLRAMPEWLRHKLHLPKRLREALDGAYTRRFVFAEHHQSHAASAFYPSPFEEAAILTLDGVGEWATASVGIGRGHTIELVEQLRFPHSLGLLYSAFTHYCGFRVNWGEYKLMGLAPYGEPRYVDTILEHLLDLKEDGSFRLDMSYFDYCRGLTMTSKRFDALFGRGPRVPESPIDAHTMDVAASIQAVTEQIVLRIARHVHRRTGQSRLCMAGGVALNCVANGRVLREGPFEQLWIQPAAGDAGGALGVAMLIWHQLLGHERAPRGDGSDRQRASLLGPRATDAQIEATLDSHGAVYTRHRSEEETIDAVASMLADEQVVGWMQGRMEFGPRALGCRSILADARSPRMQSTLNLKIKFRESFRPFAPSVLRERAPAWFQLRPQDDSPYMLLVAPVHEDQRRSLSDEQAQLEGLERLTVPRSIIPAVTHVDGTARVQTVDEQRHGRYYRLLARFEQRTGTPVLINTSFNVRGEPIVCTPDDAYRCFMATDMDVLVIEDYVLRKDQQPPVASPGAAERQRSDRSPARSSWEAVAGSCSPLVERHRELGDRELRWFGLIALSFFSLVAALLAWRFDSPRAGLSVFVTVAVVVSAYYAVPRLRRPIVRGWLTVTYPLAWLVSHATMVVLYFGVLTPVAVVFKLIGRDVLERRFESAASYWTEHRDQGDPHRYFRQF